jgi:hypothetical protein
MAELAKPARLTDTGGPNVARKKVPPPKRCAQRRDVDTPPLAPGAVRRPALCWPADVRRAPQHGARRIKPLEDELSLLRAALVLLNLAASYEECSSRPRSGGVPASRAEIMLEERFLDGRLTVGDLMWFADRSYQERFLGPVARIADASVGLDERRRMEKWDASRFRDRVSACVQHELHLGGTSEWVQAITDEVVRAIDLWYGRDPRAPLGTYADESVHGRRKFVLDELWAGSEGLLQSGSSLEKRIYHVRPGMRDRPGRTQPRDAQAVAAASPQLFGQPMRYGDVPVAPRVVAYALHLLGCPVDRRHEIVEQRVAQWVHGPWAKHMGHLPIIEPWRCDFESDPVDGDIADLRQAVLMLTNFVALHYQKEPSASSTWEALSAWRRRLRGGRLSLFQVRELCRRVRDPRKRRRTRIPAEFPLRARVLDFLLEAFDWPSEERVAIRDEAARWPSGSLPEVAVGRPTEAFAFDLPIPPFPIPVTEVITMVSPTVDLPSATGQAGTGQPIEAKTAADAPWQEQQAPISAGSAITRPEAKAASSSGTSSRGPGARRRRPPPRDR